MRSDAQDCAMNGSMDGPIPTISWRELCHYHRTRRTHGIDRTLCCSESGHSQSNASGVAERWHLAQCAGTSGLVHQARHAAMQSSGQAVIRSVVEAALVRSNQVRAHVRTRPIRVSDAAFAVAACASVGLSIHPFVVVVVVVDPAIDRSIAAEDRRVGLTRAWCLGRNGCRRSPWLDDRGTRGIILRALASVGTHTPWRTEVRVAS